MDSQGEKRKRENKEPESNKKQKSNELPTVNIVILDIEGTTTPISFVADVLFPYIRNNLTEHLNTNWGTSELISDIFELGKQAKKDIEEDIKETTEIPFFDDEEKLKNEEEKENIIEKIKENIIYQMDKDRKIGPLKQLQGHIWLNAYKSKKITGKVYDDVLDNFKLWKEKNIPIYIYSSGSIAAQKLLFGYSCFGDLLHYFSGHFDTNIGLKVEPQSYKNIANDISINPEKILFVTDNIKEAEASSTIGITSVLADRPGNAMLPKEHTFQVVDNFSKLWGIVQFEESVPKETTSIDS